MIPRWIQRTVKTPFSVLDKVFSPGAHLQYSISQKKFTVAFQFLEREKVRLATLQEHLKEVQEIERRTGASPISSRDKSSEVYIPTTLPDLPRLARDSLPIPAPAIGSIVHSGAFPPPALSYQSRSASDGSVKKVRKREYLEKEERDTGFYEGAMNSTWGGREGAYSGEHDDSPFLPLAGSSTHAAPVSYHHQSHSESDRPVKKARTRYHSNAEKESGFYSKLDDPEFHEDMIMDESGEAEGAHADWRRGDPNTVGKGFYMDESPSLRQASASPPAWSGH